MSALASRTSVEQIQQGIELKLKELLEVHASVRKLLERALLPLLACVTLHTRSSC